jgi:molybdopterin synthase sulfur carrier subunit
MQVHIKLFATLRQQAGWAEKTVVRQRAAEAAGLDLRDRALYAAVNRGYASLTDTLADGDTLALFPPVSGGAHG